MKKEPVVQYGASPSITDLLRKERIALLASTYQAQRVLLFHGQDSGRMNMLMRTMPKPTGLYYGQDCLAICCRNQIWQFRRTPKLQGDDQELLNCDWIYSPQKSYVTGSIQAHQIRLINDELIFVNTSFSCIAAVSDNYSFKPIWQPDFITDLLPEDRCHLNGFCTDANGDLKYASALGQTNTKDGWRKEKVAGGIIIDIPSNKIVIDSLCMPHSPLLSGETLLFLESGTGSILSIDLQSGQRRTCVTLPGFLRGITVHKNIMFVGLSQIRETAIFGDLPISKSDTKLECAIYALALPSFEVLGAIQFTKGIEEIFDIVVIPEVTRPHLVGFEEDTIDRIVVLP